MNKSNSSDKESKGKALVDEAVIHKPTQDPDKQPSSRGGGGLPPSDAPVVLLHRRGRADSNMLADFQKEDDALKYTKQHRLLIVYREHVGQQLRLYYLPE